MEWEVDKSMFDMLLFHGTDGLIDVHGHGGHSTRKGISILDSPFILLIIVNLKGE